jgi:hypothetical protein
MDIPALVKLMDPAIEAKNWRLIVAIYAAAIILDKRKGIEFPWSDVAKKVRKRFWYVPNVMEVLKLHAWTHIKSAKTRQAALGVAIRPDWPIMPTQELPRLWRAAGVVVSNAVAIALTLAGFAVTIRAVWGLILWTYHPELSQMDVLFRTWGNLKHWGI